MKGGRTRKNGNEKRPSTSDLPLHVVAATALHFLEKLPNQTRSPRTAVERAISFLELCLEEIETYHHARLNSEYSRKELAAQGWVGTDAISYAEGIKFITGQSRLDRAQAYYEAFLKKHPFRQRALTTRELTARLKADEEKGFIAGWLLLLRGQFNGARSEGLLKIKRRKKKI
jgi:hypothetical protein